MKKIFIAAACLMLGSFALAEPQAAFSSDQTEAIQKIVHEYLVTHPEVLIEASQELQKRAEEKQQNEALVAIEKNKLLLFKNTSSPVAGNKAGRVVLVEFLDYQCGHCKEMSDIVSSLIKKNPDLKVVFKQLPIFGQSSQYAAKLALASEKQGKYYGFHKVLMQAPNPLNKEGVLKAASTVGLNTTQLLTDAKDPQIERELKTNLQLAKDLSLIGTPAFIIADSSLSKFRFVPGATTEQYLSEEITQVDQ